MQAAESSGEAAAPQDGRHGRRERRPHHPVAPEKARLLAGHGAGLARPVVVVAAEVEDPVHEVPVHLVEQRSPPGAGAPDGRVDRDGDVPEMGAGPGRIVGREGEDVGGPVDPAPAPVQRSDGAVAGEEQREGLPSAAEGAQVLPGPGAQPGGQAPAEGVLAAQLDGHGRTSWSGPAPAGVGSPRER
jgi:hypothetical protein